jgi:uncharacterized protein (DUF2141 family)
MHKVVTAVALAFALTSQQQQQPRDLLPGTPGTGRIAGTVVDAESGRSVRFAKVTLMSSMDDREAVTDEGGAFSFDSLKPGHYRLQVSKPGYLETAYGQARPGTDTPGKDILLAGRAAVVTIVVPLSHGGSISGVVRDERGDPAFQAMVTVSRWLTSFGVRRLMPVDATTTDERGIYRFSRLPPRDYVLSASPSDDAVPDTKDGPHPFGFASSFYPGVPTATAAEPVSLRLGEQKSGMDLQLPLVALGRVSGTVVDGNGRPVNGAMVTVLPKDADSTDFSQSTHTDKNGRFLFEKVLPGAYTMTASTIPDQDRIAFHGRLKLDSTHFEVTTRLFSKELKEIRGVGTYSPVDTDPSPGVVEPPGSASSDLTVAGGGETNSTLTLEPPRKVAGRLIFEGPSKPQPAKDIRVEMLTILINGGPPGVNVNDDGTFELTNVVPGRYSITIGGATAPWSLASATSGGVDVLDFFLDVPRDRDVRDLTITLRDRYTELTGSVVDGAGQPAGERTVVVFPSDERLWAGAHRVDADNLLADGTYVFRDLRPGRYLVAVVDGVEHGEWLDPNFLRRLVPAAVPVTLGDGERKVQDLRVR